ncbi:FlgO family outer membrane protein [Paucibacter sp. M5-1]|uniref:FlgO family outer membrane protein n=1 Tax=Paucibacter sp. M5-1 TaxID=3015998 RepID=UPI003F81D4B2
MMKTTLPRWLRRCVLFATVLLLSACAAPPAATKAPPADLITINQQAVDALLQSAPLDPSLPMLVASFVNLDVLTESSRLGRLFSEQVSGRLVNRGYPVIELKLRDKLFMKHSEGALLLSRELRDISRKHQAQAVVVGTYTASTQFLYLSLKLVGGEQGNLVLAAHDYAIPLDANVRALLVN